MEDIKFGNYLNSPSQVQKALDLLDQNCETLGFKDLFLLFNKALGITPGGQYPVTIAHISGKICRARLNDKSFNTAHNVLEIGVKLENISQGRANHVGFPVFYGANTKSTAAFEVLQDKPPGLYNVTIGCWASEHEMPLANLVDGSDPDFIKLPNVHSLPKEYVKDWPKLPGESAVLLTDYSRTKFKLPKTEGLYNITNVLAGVYYSLKDVIGIGYAAVSDNFDGYNIALRDFSQLKCVTVERWLINKIDNNTHKHKLMQAGTIQSNGMIIWE